MDDFHILEKHNIKSWILHNGSFVYLLWVKISELTTNMKEKKTVPILLQ